MEVKFRIGSYRFPVKLERKEGRIFFDFPFNRDIMTEIKMMQGSHWHGFDEHKPLKIWSVKDCQRNWFQLKFLMRIGAEDDPYNHFDKPVDPDQLNVPTERFHKVQ